MAQQSDAHRKAASERMKARHAQKRLEKAQAEMGEQNQNPEEIKSEPNITNDVKQSDAPLQQPAAAGGMMFTDDQFKQLLAAISSKPSANPTEALSQMSATLGTKGVMGIVYKYPVEKSHYPDPSERLYDEPDLKRHALHDNFVFKWDVSGITYEKNNITYSEPRFTLQLFKKQFDDEGVFAPTKGLILLGTDIMHEDELTTKVVASKLGLLDKFEAFDGLMNEVRYLRFREWLLSLFRPQRLENHIRQRNTLIVGGKVVEIFDTEEIIDAETGQARAGAMS